MNATYALILCLALFQSCNYQAKVTCSDLNDFDLVLNGLEKFALDSTSTFRPTAVYTSETDEPLMIIDNEELGRIDIYNLKTKLLHKRIQLISDGPNGIKQSFSGYFFRNMDSIFLFFNVSQQLLLIDSDGIIKNKFGSITRWTEQAKTPTVDVTGAMKPILRNNTIEFGTYALASSDGKAGLVYDLETQTTRIPYTLPDIYKTGWWSGLNYDRVSQAYNKKEEIVVLSYGADKYIYVITQDGDVKKVCASSRYLPDQLKPYSPKIQDLNQHFQQLWKHEALQGSYSTIIYDQWKEVYYRIAFRPITESEYTSPNLVWSKPTIIILDKEFRKVGESILPAGYYYAIHYVTPDGLFFANRDEYDRNDDFMVFGKFNLQKTQ